MNSKFITIFFLFAFIVNLNAQNGHGDAINRAKNTHAGNLIRVTFHNNGRLGTVEGDQSVVYTGEWPIGTGKVQMGNTSAYVMTALRIPIDTVDGKIIDSVVTPVIFCEGWDPDLFSHDPVAGTFYGFEPLPGYLNLTQKEIDPYHAVAMSHQAFTWPPYWPDKLTDQTDAGWKNHWNGYFGKDQKNADEESYYVMDDYQFNKPIKGLELPKPIPSEPKRGGLGLRMAVRGLQWSNPDAEDCIFWLYDISNIGELFLDRTLFGCNVGASSGGLLNRSGDWDDDNAKFYRDSVLAVNWDSDNTGIGGYSPVPWVGFAFLESPGNPYDGIDNDADGINPETPGGGTGKIITIDDFRKEYKVNDPIVLIDYEKTDYPREVIKMPAEGIKFTHNNKIYEKKPNVTYFEIPRNGVDDNLNGLIDESDGTTTQDSISYYLYIRDANYNNKNYLSKDYFTGNGLNNLLIDERRDDGLDNNGDWDPKLDDVGLDGQPGTGDAGEGDGIPTPGTSELPGEPNIDQVDVDESDQIGLTSFKFYRYGTLTYSNDEQMWEFSRPGYFDNKTTERADHDYVFSSGYFPLRPEQKEFFSVAMIYGEDEKDILRNKSIVQKIYNSNYNFATAPKKPILNAVAGNGVVTLTWDDAAEESFDRFLKEYDFEGYKIYKASHHTFGDAGSITDGLGYERFKQPIAIYDKVDGVYGFFPKDFGTGVLFNLGNETGLVHSYVDEDVTNGIRYYYAVTAYDKGDASKNIGPTETSIFLNVDQSGNIQFGENVIAVTPQAPALGYQAPQFDVLPKMAGEGMTNGIVGVNVLNPESILEQEEFEIQFLDQSMDMRDNDMNGLIDSEDNTELIPTTTTGFALKSITRGITYDTLWFKEYAVIKDSLDQDSVITLKDKYYDDDGDPNTLTVQMNGLEIYVYNPEPSVIDQPENGIYKGMKWCEAIEPGDTSYQLEFKRFELTGYQSGTPYPRQYEIVFHKDTVNRSERLGIYTNKGGRQYLKSVPVNFKVYDKQTKEEIKFGFSDNTKTKVPAGFFSAGDYLVLYEILSNDSTLITYRLQNTAIYDSLFLQKYGRLLGQGDNPDTLSIYPAMPYNGNTKYYFKINGQKVYTETARANLNRIKVVPNPYAASAIWEPHNAYTSGRGERLVRFINLPERCTIRIYTVDGTLVRTLEHDSPMIDGSESWDLMSKDNMDISYGIYIYHVEAPGVGEHVGRMLVIK